MTNITNKQSDIFDGDDMTVMFNTMSGNVFLTNDDYQVAMFNGDRLEMFYSCPECGNEGFADDMLTDFINQPDDVASECCRKYLEELEVIELDDDTNEWVER